MPTNRDSVVAVCTTAWNTVQTAQTARGVTNTGNAQAGQIMANPQPYQENALLSCQTTVNTASQQASDAAAASRSAASTAATINSNQQDIFNAALAALGPNPTQDQLNAFYQTTADTEFVSTNAGQADQYATAAESDRGAAAQDAASVAEYVNQFYIVYPQGGKQKAQY